MEIYLIEETFRIVRPNYGRELDETDLLRKPLLVMLLSLSIYLSQWRVGRPDVYGTEIAAL